MFTIKYPIETFLWMKVKQPVSACPYVKRQASQNQDALPGTSRDDSEDLDLGKNKLASSMVGAHFTDKKVLCVILINANLFCSLESIK